MSESSNAQGQLWLPPGGVPFGILPFVMTAEEHPLQPLHEELEQRRIASLHGPNPILQTVIAKELGWSASTVHRYVNGPRDLRKVSGREVFIILSGYGYAPSEIGGIVERYGLNYPPQLIDDMAGTVGMVSVLHEGAISRPTAAEPRSVPEAYLKGHSPDVVRLRTTSPHDLATVKASEEVRPHTLLVLHTSRTPRTDSIVIVAQDGRQALVKWPVHEPTWATPYQAGGEDAPLLLDPHKLVPVGVVISSTREHPY